MLFLAEMEVRIPHDADPEHIARLQAEEKARAQQLQRSGEWRHLWRVAGRYANISILDVRTIDRLHELLSELPLFPYLDIRVTPLATHPSAISVSVSPNLRLCGLAGAALTCGLKGSRPPKCIH